MNATKKFKKLVSKSLFEQAYNLIRDYHIDDKWKIIHQELHHLEPYRVYAFLRYLFIRESSCPDWEFYCFIYLVYCDPFFDDAMRLAAWHLRKAMEMDCENVEYTKQAISVFYSYPVRYFSDDEFLKMAVAIMRHDCNNPLAQTVIEELSTKTRHEPNE